MKSRKTLIAATIATELVLLAVAIVVTGAWLTRSVTGSVSEQALEDNQLVANQMARLIDEFALSDISYGSSDWQRLQEVVANARLPNDGFLCVTDAGSGMLLCHPKIERDPKMRSMSPGSATMVSEDGVSPIVDLVRQNGAASGRVELANKLQVVAAKPLRGVNANLMVHQLIPSMQANAARKVAPIYWIGSLVGALLLLATALGGYSLLSSYESHVERVNASLEEVVAERTRSLMKTRNAVIFGLAKLAESRDCDTGEHLDRIRDYSMLLANELVGYEPSIDSEFVRNIGLASALHDIGKVAVPDAVLLKPGRLDPQERKIIEQHPLSGCKTLVAIEAELGDDDFLDMAREICIAHHEKWDGSGYPMGLSGEQIPISARIVAVADVYDALTSKRPYKDAMSHQAAADIILKSAGSHFDPSVVLAFQDVSRQFEQLRSQAQQKTQPQEAEEPHDLRESKVL